MSVHAPIDHLWVLACAILVVLMQAGFTCVESGLVRAKNSINVAFKNLIDFCIAAVLYGVAGFGLMFGASWHGLIGVQPDILEHAGSTSWLYTLFFFQVAFCGTATTIVSGAVAERMRFAAYCAAAVMISLLIYPIVGHWAWGGVIEGFHTGWLGKAGFIDFAGSTVVHSVGGWVSLACLLIIGPRVGRFGPNGRPIEGYNLPVATLGVFLLWVGWFGFNGGSTLALDDQVPRIITNTALAGAAGGAAAMLLTWKLLGIPAVDRIMNGVLAGLVGVTAGCHLLTPLGALLVGAVGGAVCMLGTQLLERRQIDDAVGAVPVHLFAGIWGTLAVALCAPDGSWGEGVTRWQQLQVQLLGIVSIGVFSFGLAFVVLYLFNRWMPLRVSRDDERIGLNIAEHGASSAVLDLIVQMDRQARSGDFASRVDVEPETEAARIAVFYNAVLDRFAVESSRRQMAMRKLAQLANYDTLTGLGTRRLFLEAVRRAARKLRGTSAQGALLYVDLDDFKLINDRYGHAFGDQLLRHAAKRMTVLVPDGGAVLGRLGGDEFAIVIARIDGVEAAEILADELLIALSVPFELESRQFEIHASVGIALFDGSDDNAERIIRRADEAMYVAKLAGKRGWRLEGRDTDEFAPDL
ncbi:ammonium transporter [Solimonas marina]|uniref:Ammonium transporter n=1 Tax=Solimonas marina TaxID=2714601 RepID=A0A969WAE9_9GAMM|nr:ammonium transporter [Solimonas marina]NKF23322.1 ammonium transporter [Solimonas marina]